MTIQIVLTEPDARWERNRDTGKYKSFCVTHILILNDGIKRLYSCQKMRDDVFSSSTNLRLGSSNLETRGD